MNFRNMNTQNEMSPRQRGGAIDSAYYMQRARELRVLALKEYWGRATRWMPRHMQALWRSIKCRRPKLKEANHLDNATLQVPAGGARINLSRGRLIRVQDGGGFRIHCYSGELWITQERDLRDIVLQPGDAFILDRPGLTLVAALVNVQFAVEDPHRAMPSRDTKKSPAPTQDWRGNYARA